MCKTAKEKAFSRLNLIILAAGEGKRFGDANKPFAPIGPQGETLMDYSVSYACHAGFSRIVFVIKEEHKNKMERSFKRLTKNFSGIECFPAFPDAGWGTGYSLLAAGEKITGPFAVVNADDYYGPGAFEQMARYLRSTIEPKNSKNREMPPCLRIGMIAYRLANTLTPNGAVTRGICQLDENGRIRDIVETTGIKRKPGGEIAADGKKIIAEDSMVTMNMWGMGREFLSLLEEGFSSFSATKDQEEFILTSFIGLKLREGAVVVEPILTEDRWFGITYQEDVELARRQIEKHRLSL